MGFCFSNPGHRMTRHIFTWMNSFLNAVIHHWVWLKVLNLPTTADLEKYVTMRVDGDNNYHMGPVIVVNEENLRKFAFYMKKANINIRNGVSAGYAITKNPSEIDYLSHYYRPVAVACGSEDPGAQPPRRDIAGA